MAQIMAATVQFLDMLGLTTYFQIWIGAILLISVIGIAVDRMRH